MASIIYESGHLEMGTGPKGKDCVMVCPHCKNGVYVTKNTAGIICGRCRDYFSKEQSLTIGEALFFENNSIHLSDEYMKFRGDMETRAYQYRDRQNRLAASGEMPIFEAPGTHVRNLPHKPSAYRKRFQKNG